MSIILLGFPLIQFFFCHFKRSFISGDYFLHSFVFNVLLRDEFRIFYNMIWFSHHETYGSALETEFFSEFLSHKTHVVRFEHGLVIDEDNKGGWSWLNLRDKTDLQLTSTFCRCILNFFESVQPVIERSCWDSDVPFLVRFENIVHHLVFIIWGVLCTHTMKINSSYLCETFFKLSIHVSKCLLLVIFRNKIPLVNDNDKGSTLVTNILCKGEILCLKSSESINHANYYMWLLHRSDRIPLDFLLYFRYLCNFLVNSCSIDKVYLSSSINPLDFNSIASCASQIIRYHSIFLKKIIH